MPSLLRIPWISRGWTPAIFFRIDWFDLLAVQGTLKSLLQHHSSKASILRRSAFLTVQLSHPYMTTGNIFLLFKVFCRGPAPADPGYSKERRRRRRSGNNCLIKVN